MYLDERDRIIYAPEQGARSLLSLRRLPRTHELFVLNGIVSLFWATVWMWRDPEMLLQYFYYGHILALTHLVTLGFLTSMMMGVVLRLAPLLLKVEPVSSRIASWQLALFLIGSWGMIAHFRLGEATGMSWSAGLVLVAAILQIWNFRGLFERASTDPWPRRFVAASLVFFALAASLGVVLALLKAYGFHPVILADDYLANVFAHAHLAGVGWVANMIFGFQLRIVPTTAGSARSLPHRFALLQLGTLGLAAAFLSEITIVPFAVPVVVACVWQAWSPARSFLRGRTREWDMAPLFVLGITATLGLVLALGWPDVRDPARGRVQLAYGFLALHGFMVSTVATVAFKLFPIWVWKERFQPEFGKVPVPGMKDLPSRTLTRFASAAILGGTLAVALSIATANLLGLRVSTTLLLAGVLAFGANLLRVVRHTLVDIGASS